MNNVKTFWRILILFWCRMLFYQSSKPAPESEKQSMFIVTAVNQWVRAVIGKEVCVVSNAMVRKAAHFIEYLFLGTLLFNGFFSGKTLRKVFFLSLSAGIAYAVSDEIHQYFVPGRTMCMIDILTDAAGIFYGAGLEKA